MAASRHPSDREGGPSGPSALHLEVVTANVTSLVSQFEAVVALPAAVLILQDPPGLGKWFSGP
jgi:hypothetical protein